MTATESEKLDKTTARAGPTVTVSEWIVGTPDRQHATIDAFRVVWELAPWPDGLLATTLLASTDGEAVLNYARWTSDEAHNKFVETQCRALAERLDRAVPGIQRQPAVNYRLYRSGVRQSAPAPGCVVIVSVEFEGPDERRQRRWIDTVFEAMAAEPLLPPGGISGHFHISIDGTRVLNYAEWTNEKAHQDALDQSGQGAIGSGPKWREIRSFPGLKSTAFRRYRFGLSVIPPDTQRKKCSIRLSSPSWSEAQDRGASLPLSPIGSQIEPAGVTTCP